MGRNVPKRDSLNRLRCAMLDIDRSEAILDGEFVNVDEPACVELVPVTQSVNWAPKPAPRPDPSFLAQLIATADQAPQTRSLRRASLADAQTAYGAGQSDPAARASEPGRRSNSALRCIRLVRERCRLYSRRRDFRRRHLCRGTLAAGASAGWWGEPVSVQGDPAVPIRRPKLPAERAPQVARRAWTQVKAPGTAARQPALRLLLSLLDGVGAATATARRRVRKARPDRKIHERQGSRQEKVEVPNFGHSTNSAAAAPNTISESRWSVRYFAPGRAPLMTSASNNRMPSVSSTSLSVTVHSAPDINASFTSGWVTQRGHQEDDDVVDRERNQGRRRTDHGYRALLGNRNVPGRITLLHRGEPLAHSLAKFGQTPLTAAPIPCPVRIPSST